MQGELFVRGGSPKKPIADNAKTRLKTFQALYRRKYGHVAPIASIGAAMAMLKRWQAEAIPTAALWAEVVDVYLRQSDLGVTDAEHPLGWLPRRLPAILPVAKRQVEQEALDRRLKAEAEAAAARRAEIDARRAKYPGIELDETVEAYQARMAAKVAEPARRRAVESPYYKSHRRWA